MLIPRLVALCMCALASTTHGAQRTIIQNATLVMPAAMAPNTTIPHQTIVVTDGIITSIEAADAERERAAFAPGDVPIDGSNAFVLPGRIVELERPPTYAKLARLTSEGVTTVVTTISNTELRWMETISKTAAFPIPSLVAASANPSKEDAAGALSTATREDRGRIAIGQRGDLVLVDANPLEQPATVKTPRDVIIGGRVWRRAALETNRRMILEADAAIADQPRAADGERAYEIESSGLHVGRLILASDGTVGRDWWGPPIRQTTNWTIRPTAEVPQGWTLSLQQRVHHGFEVTMSIERGAVATIARAQLVAPETFDPVETKLEAAPEQPLLDPVSLLLRLRERVVALAEGAAMVVEVIEPVPVPGEVKVGVRSVRIARVAPDASAIPSESGQRVIRIEAVLPQRLPDELRGANPIDPLIGWVVTDATGVPVRAALIAPEGITEYFLSLPPSAAPIARE